MQSARESMRFCDHRWENMRKIKSKVKQISIKTSNISQKTLLKTPTPATCPCAIGLMTFSIFRRNLIST